MKHSQGLVSFPIKHVWDNLLPCGSWGEQMYLKKIDGPRAVTLKDGRIFTRADLPVPDTRRWVASRKAAVVTGIVSGLISESEALKTWGLSQEELSEWIEALQSHGEAALKATQVQKYRQL